MDPDRIPKKPKVLSHSNLKSGFAIVGSSLAFSSMSYAIISVIISVALCEAIKIGNSLYKKERVKPFKMGGIPSMHSASVTALSVSIYLEQGFSLLLLACVVFGWVVIRDACGVRWEISKHSKALNKLTNSSKYAHTIGHKKMEVIAGVLLGLVVTLIVYSSAALF